MTLPRDICNKINYIIYLYQDVQHLTNISKVKRPTLLTRALKWSHIMAPDLLSSDINTKQHVYIYINTILQVMKAPSYYKSNQMPLLIHESNVNHAPHSMNIHFIVRGIILTDILYM